MSHLPALLSSPRLSSLFLPFLHLSFPYLPVNLIARLSIPVFFSPYLFPRVLRLPHFSILAPSYYSSFHFPTGVSLLPSSSNLFSIFPCPLLLCAPHSLSPFCSFPLSSSYIFPCSSPPCLWSPPSLYTHTAPLSPCPHYHFIAAPGLSLSDVALFHSVFIYTITGSVVSPGASWL